MPAQIGLYRPPQGPSHEDGTPFRSDDATIRSVIAWHRDSPSRRTESAVAETERRRLWLLFCEHRTDPGSPATFGDRPHQSCRPFELLNFINSSLGRGASDWTRKRWNGTLQSPFNEAERMGLIAKNPFRGLTFPEGEGGRDWTDDEYQTVLRNSRPHFRRLIVALRFSGLRPGEGCELAFPRIRIEEGRVVIDHHKTRRHTRKPRVIPTNTVLVNLFEWLRKHNPPGAAGVVLNSFGRPWVRSMADTTLRRIRRKVNAKVATLRGAIDETGRPVPPRLLVALPDDVRLHGNRHMFATQAIMNGVSLAEVAAILGHANAAMTAKRYSHVEDKTAHLAGPMEQAIHRKPKPRPASPAVRKRPEPPATPLFDGLG